ncbi:glutathione S-transferase family protein [Roseobacter weihaiensis]|uniref:glutathione S-transferase family protein n=1 Tax=Roseobacter weihaiensis TaxID=2763262 RepID=UPI001D09DEC3|nr:glutathione S-transferase family protein [Roseobacter sp. H9]
MRLYYAPGTISVAVAIALHEAGLEFEPVLVSFKEAAQTKPDFLAVNPKGRVPTLEISGTYLTETGALLDYIAAIAPDAGLVPADPLEAAHMRSVMYYLASTMHVNHAHGRRGSRWADAPESHADMAAKVPHTMAESARYVQNHCLRGPFVMGAGFSIADPYLFMLCSWLTGDGVELADFPRIAAYLERMRARASVRAVTDQGMLPA